MKRRRWLRRALLLVVAAWATLWLLERGIAVCRPLPAGGLDPHLASRRVSASDGTWLRVLPNALGERCIPVPLAEVSPHVVRALLAAEDRHFRTHSGVDFAAVLRAVGQNWSRGRTFSGASTLTMQLARVLDTTPRTFLGKLGQALRARQIERAFGKDAILEAYLSAVPFAGNTRGVEAAAERWFGKHAKDLDLVEAATLVGMLPAPGRRSPTARPELVKRCRDEVLRAVHASGELTDEDLARALARPLDASRHAWPWLAAAATDLALRNSTERHVRTTLDPVLQRRAEDVVEHGRGLTVTGVAIVILARENGDLLALVGGRDPTHPGLDHAQRARPAGSTLKPLLWGLALESGILGTSSLVADVPIEIAGYRPVNFSRTFAGATPMQDALADSKNVPAVRLLRQVGMNAFRDHLATLGIPTGSRALGLDLALGTLSVRPLDLARAFQRRFAPRGALALSPEHQATLLTTLARRSPDPNWLAAGDLAWKTGTSSDRRDAWSVGITERHVVVVWAGASSGRSEPGLVGARAAAELLAPLVATTR